MNSTVSYQTEQLTKLFVTYFYDKYTLSPRQRVVEAYKLLYFDDDQINRLMENCVLGWQNRTLLECMASTQEAVKNRFIPDLSDVDSLKWYKLLLDLVDIELEFRTLGDEISV